MAGQKRVNYGYDIRKEYDDFIKAENTGDRNVLKVRSSNNSESNIVPVYLSGRGQTKSGRGISMVCGTFWVIRGMKKLIVVERIGISQELSVLDE